MKTIISGFISGKLTAISEYDKTKAGIIRWLCQCECGKNSIVTVYNLLNNHTLSCGCTRVEKLNVLYTKHSLHGTDEYFCWKNMKGRCLNPNSDNYKNY